MTLVQDQVFKERYRKQPECHFSVTFSVPYYVLGQKKYGKYLNVPEMNKSLQKVAEMSEKICSVYAFAVQGIGFCFTLCSNVLCTYNGKSAKYIGSPTDAISIIPGINSLWVDLC